MLRTLVAAGLVYTWGHPALDGYRPALLDRPLQSFYADVNTTARDGRRAFSVLDDARTLRYLKGYVDRLDALRTAL
jgi:hypothetical protein